MTIKEKRPQDWHMTEKLQAIIDCAPLADEAKSAYCRQKGIYTLHIKQWKQDFLQSKPEGKGQQNRRQLKALKDENKQLKFELKRKEKALAETAALLVLKKKSNKFGEATRSA